MEIRVQTAPDLVTARNLSRLLASFSAVRDGIQMATLGPESLDSWNLYREEWLWPGHDILSQELFFLLGEAWLKNRQWPRMSQRDVAISAQFLMTLPRQENDLQLSAIGLGSVIIVIKDIIDRILRPFSTVVALSTEVPGEENAEQKSGVLLRVLNESEGYNGDPASAGVLLVGIESLTSAYRQMEVKRVDISPTDRF